MDEWDDRKTWYHGSPYELTTIHQGSTITRDRALSRIFSHKPTLVSISEDGKIQHNGTLPGFLYCIAEEIQPEDVYPHPHSSMAWGKEWLTERELQVRWIGLTKVLEEERLTEEGIAELRRMAQLQDEKLKIEIARCDANNKNK